MSMHSSLPKIRWAQLVALYLPLLALTLAYWRLVTLGMGAYEAAVAKEIAESPLYAVVLAQSPTLWQALALLSLGLHFAWGIYRSGDGSADGHVLPAICHAAWILAFLLVNMIGMLEPLIHRASVIR